MTDKGTRRPGYRAIAAALSGSIGDGTYGPGEVLPSEQDIVAEFGVARETARRALKELEGQGLVHTVHGRGRFVIDSAPAENVIRPVQRPVGVTAR